jgi:hypothetical protein
VYQNVTFCNINIMYRYFIVAVRCECCHTSYTKRVLLFVLYYICKCHCFFFLQGPSYEQLKNIRATNILTPFAPDFKEPLLIHDGKMQWLFDHTGRRYLDMFGGILTVSVGHCHP